MARFVFNKKGPEVTMYVNIAVDDDQEEREVYRKGREFFAQLEVALVGIARVFYKHDTITGTFITVKCHLSDEDVVNERIDELRDKIFPY